jgi:hypothetical protein
MTTIAERLAAVHERIAAAAARAGRAASSVTLVAVSKTHPPSLIREAARAGQRDFGENYVQELVEKRAALVDLDPPPRWHYIGRLQRNKAKDVAGRCALVHAVDGAKLAAEIDRRALAAGAAQDVLVQVNLSGEATKGGVSEAELPALLDAIRPLARVRCVGLMTMPPPVDDAELNRPFFRRLASLARAHALPELSMGMSDDFEVAIEEGATLVRVGTAIFGARQQDR